MMHPSRLGYADYLRERLGEVAIIVDEHERGAWPTCRRAWLAHDPACDYHLVLNDDALVCRDFRERFTALLATREPVYSLYMGWRKAYVEQAEQGLLDGYVRLPRLHWGIANVLRSDLIAPMIAVGDSLDLPPVHDDTRIKAFLKQCGLGCYYPMPSLIDHRTDTVSLATGEPTAPERKAFYFVGE